MLLDRLTSFLGTTFGAALVASCCTPGPASNLSVTLHPQETSSWCWAASGQMVMDNLGNNVAQCIQANNRFNRTDCPCDQCGSDPITSPPCVQGGWPEFDKYGFTFKRTSNTALTWDELTEELAQNRRCGATPIAFSWRWNGGGGHMMVATGYVEVGGVQYVKIYDPLIPCIGDTRFIPYAAYVSGASYTHWDDFYQVRD